MKITKDDYEKFYFGESNEKFIQSEFYSQGYEALKTSPDIGYDLLITNCARTKFLGEETRQYNIQIKGRVYYDNTVSFFIDEEDFNYLLNDVNGYLICVLCKPVLSFGRENITVYRTPDPVLDSHIAEDFEETILKENGYLSLKYLKEHNISYIGYNRKYVWFNNAQLNRLNNEKLVLKKPHKKGPQICINISDNDDSMTIVNSENEPYEIESNVLNNSTTIAYEQNHIKYLVSCDVTDDKMFEGDCYL